MLCLVLNMVYDKLVITDSKVLGNVKERNDDRWNKGKWNILWG